jgi:hypothetical protein
LSADTDLINAFRRVEFSGYRVSELVQARFCGGIKIGITTVGSF